MIVSEKVTFVCEYRKCLHVFDCILRGVLLLLLFLCCSSVHHEWLVGFCWLVTSASAVHIRLQNKDNKSTNNNNKKNLLENSPTLKQKKLSMCC